jgi:hypothetical protein
MPSEWNNGMLEYWDIGILGYWDKSGNKPF